MVISTNIKKLYSLLIMEIRILQNKKSLIRNFVVLACFAVLTIRFFWLKSFSLKHFLCEFIIHLEVLSLTVSSLKKFVVTACALLLIGDFLHVFQTCDIFGVFSISVKETTFSLMQIVKY